MDQSFTFTPSDAVYHYHSIYDSQQFQEVYADPGFHRHVGPIISCLRVFLKIFFLQVTVAKHLGLVSLRLTDGIILPLNTTQYALELTDYLDQYASRLVSYC